MSARVTFPLLIYRGVVALLLPLLYWGAILEKYLSPRHWPSSWRLRDRLGYGLPIPKSGPVWWFHAASLGEAKGMLALARFTTMGWSGSRILTVNTLAAYTFIRAELVHESDREGWHILFAPFDHPGLVRFFLRRLHIQKLILFEVELWPHFVLSAHAMKIQVLWVSVRWTAKAQSLYGLFPSSLAVLLGQVAWILAQDESEAESLRRHGCQHVEVGPDLKGLHYLPMLAIESPPIPNVDWQKRNGAAFISIHAEELPSLLEVLKILRQTMPVLVFPRQMRELPYFIKKLSPLGFQAYSHGPGRLQIVDSMGQVANLLSHCHVGFVGGSYGPWGGHNLWEPLNAGLAMVIGPSYQNQTYLAEQLKQKGLLIVATDRLNPAWFTKPSEDPTPEFRFFVEKERMALQNALERMRPYLGRFDQSIIFRS